MKTCTFVIGFLLSAMTSYAAPGSGADRHAAGTPITERIAADPFTVCIEAEDSDGDGPITEDPNASNGKTRGAQDAWNHYVDYVVPNAPAGRYNLTLRYYAEGDAVVWVSINGQETAPMVGLPATHSWNIVWAERTIDVNLTQGYNKIRIGGMPFYSPTRQDKICLTQTDGPSQPVQCDFHVRPWAVGTWPIYQPGQSVTLDSRCTGGDCGTANFSWTGNGLNATGATTTFNAPTTPGDYRYFLNASKPGCADTTDSVLIRVQTTPAVCDYVAGSIVTDLNPSCGQGIGASADCFGTGCPGVSYRWTGPGVDVTGSTVEFYAPKENGVFTFTRTSSKPGCPDQTSSFKLTVTDCGNGPYKLCLESEDAGGTGPVTEDPNASGGKTRGGQDRDNYSVYYVVPDVKQEGPHAITFRYYAEMNTAIEVKLINDVVPHKIELPASNSWNIVWKEYTAVFVLKKGFNIIDVRGVPGYSPVRHDKICIEQLPGTAPACDFTVTAQASTTTPQCGSTFTMSADCTGPDCGSVYYNWYGSDGFARFTQTIDVTAPSANGTYYLTLQAGKDGCAPKVIDMPYSVTSCVPSGSGEPIGCVEAEHSASNGPGSDDPNASNGQTRGAQDNYDYYVDYRVDNVAKAGFFPVTLRYYAPSEAQVSVSVNDVVVIPSLNLAPTYSWNIVTREETIYITLFEGTNTIRIQGLPGAAIRQDKICIGADQNARMAAPQLQMPVSDTPLLRAFPNPAPGEFQATFQLDAGKAGTIRVTDVQGRIWHQRKVTGNGAHQERIRLDDAPAGIYLLQVQKPDSIETKKILLTH